ncbi:MAG: hypothetical protein RLY16_2375 [Bacteroidota bacterium]
MKNKINLTLFSVVIFCLSLQQHAMAQSDALQTLTAESGDKANQTAICWVLNNISYSNNQGYVIAGNYSMRTATSPSLSLTNTYIKSPWIHLNTGNINFQLKFDATSGATTRKIIFSYISYNAGASQKENAPVRFDSVAFAGSSASPLPTTTQNISISLPSGLAGTSNHYKILVSFTGEGGNTRFILDNLNIPAQYWANPSNHCYPKRSENGGDDDHDSDDDDNDEIENDDDDYPTDAARAFDTYYPSASTYGTLLFEDLWPAAGDYDFNDLVLNYRVQRISNAKTEVVQLQITYIVKATGASFRNGFAIQLDNVLPSQISSVTGTKTSDAAWLSVASNGVENGQQWANIIVYDNINNFFRNPGTNGVNTTFGVATTAPDTATLVINFNNSAGAININEIVINPYLIVNQIRTREVHLMNFTPTSKASRTEFGTSDDRSSSNTNTYYKSSHSLPWALDIPKEIPHLREGLDFLTGYLQFVNWVESNGNNYVNWYEDLNGYRNVSNLY